MYFHHWTPSYWWFLVFQVVTKGFLNCWSTENTSFFFFLWKKKKRKKNTNNSFFPHPMQVSPCDLMLTLLKYFSFFETQPEKNKTRKAGLIEVHCLQTEIQKLLSYIWHYDVLIYCWKSNKDKVFLIKAECLCY